MYRILIVDDHLLFRAVVKRWLEKEPAFHIAGEASTGLEAVELARRLQPDVVLMDLRMPEMGGIEATRCIKAERPEVRVIGLSVSDGAEIVHRFQEAGAEGFVHKSDRCFLELSITICSNGRVAIR